MPLLSVILPSLTIGCKHAFARKLTLYLVVPFGLLSGVFGYPRHGSRAVVVGSWGGVAAVVLAVTWSPIASYRTALNLAGCAVMLGSQYIGEQIARGRSTRTSAGSSEPRSCCAGKSCSG